MIRINLLPEEYQRAGKVPPQTLGLLVSACLLGFGGVACLAFMFFRVRAGSVSRVEIAQEELNNLAPQATYADNLETEKAEFAKRSKTIQEIAGSRILWSRKMDRMSAIVNQDVATGRHQVWLGQIKVNSRVDSRTAGRIELKGMSATGNIEKVSNFHEDLQTDSVFVDGFDSFTAPTSKLGKYEDELDPPEMMEFEFDVKLPEPKK